jgi:hypothetical protein
MISKPVLKMSMPARFAILSMFTLLLTGCLPIPHFNYRAPAVSGIIIQNGAPVANAQVQVTDEIPSGNGERTTAVTNADGRFATEPIREFRFVFALIGEEFYWYTVQITAAGRIYPGYSSSRLGYSRTKKLELRCDLSHPQTLRDGQQTYCEAMNDEENL